VSTIASVFVFNFVINGTFLFGSTLVFLATYLYGMSDQISNIPTQTKRFADLLLPNDVEAKAPLLEK